MPSPAHVAARRNVTLYPWFSAVVVTPVFLPVLVLFYQENGLDLAQVFLIQGLFSAAMVALEVPTGMLADRLGKRRGLVLACLAMSASMVVYGLSGSFAAFLLAEVIFAIGAALLSGADTALLYDSLKLLGREAEYTRLEGRASSVRMVAFALCNLLGGALGSVDLRATLWVSAIGPLIAFLIALRFREVLPQAPADSARESLRSSATLLGQALKFVRKHQLVRWYVTLMAVLTGCSGWLLWMYQPYMELGGLPVWAFGVAFASFNLVAAASSHLAHRVEDLLGERGVLYALAVFHVGAVLLLALFVGPLSFVFVWGHQVVRGLGRPIINRRILRFTYADKRATVLSLASLVGRLFFAVTGPVMGWFVARTDLVTGLWAQAAIGAALLAMLFIALRRVPEKYFKVKAAVLQRS